MREADWQPDDLPDYCRRCGRSTPTKAGAADCPKCAGSRLPWDQAVRLGVYGGVLRDAIHEVKFSRWRRLGHDLGRLLGEAIAGRLAEEALNSEDAAIVPMPTSFRRRMARGVDHALVIARGASDASGLPIVRPLERRHGPPQVGLSGHRRLRNVAGMFAFRMGRVRLPPVLIVIDDVMTTGATMRAACRAIRRGMSPGDDGLGVQVWAAVLGVAELVPSATGMDQKSARKT